MARFTGKIAIITGASVGTGPVMAKMMADEGARVVVAARRLDLLDEVVKDIGDAAIAVQADVTREGDVIALVDAAMDKWGQVDVLMNTAAIPGQDKYIWEQTLENWNTTFAVDTTAAMLCSREVLRRSMIERKTGSIVNFSSIASWNGMQRKSHYSVAKAGLRVLTKVIAMEVGPHGVRCNCVVPGAIDTGNYQNWLRRMAGEKGTTYEEERTAAVAGTPLRTMSTTEDVARLALFLASDDARTITGQSINVDAGVVMIG